MKNYTAGVFIIIMSFIFLSGCYAEKSKRIAFETAIGDNDLEKIESMLKKGYNPNYMGNITDWEFSNPLWCASYDAAKLLIQYGADTKKRPYVATLLMGRITTEKYPDQWKKFADPTINYSGGTPEEDFIPYLTLLLNSGADVNAKATPYSMMLFPPTDWNYNRVFMKKGYTALNRAIRNNAFKLVDLLLSYGAVFDNETPEFMKKATELSGTTEMADYITKLMKEQSNTASDKN